LKKGWEAGIKSYETYKNKIITKAIMTSKEFAELVDKDHKHIMREIRNKVPGTSAQLSTYMDAQNKERPQYIIDRKAVMTLALRYDIKTRYKIIERLEGLVFLETIPEHVAALKLYGII